MELIALVAITTILIVVLIIIRFSLIEKMLLKDSNNVHALNVREEKSLKYSRIFYFVSCLCFILIIFILDGCSLIKENLSMGFIFIYFGLGGLVSKSGFLKLPISATSKLYYVINPILIISGIFSILSYYSILNF